MTLHGPGAVDPVFSPASPQAAALADVFARTLLVCAVIFILVAGLIIWCMLRYRRRPGGGEPKQTAGNEKLEVTWTAASILVLVWLFVLTVRAMNASDPPSDRPPDLAVIGHQWWWEVRYPNGAVTANEIHIPTGSNLLVRAGSADVIHDFWVPQLGRKIDTIPGRSNHTWLRADEPGEYLGACAEYCGAEHAWMRIRVVAEPPEEFAAWVGHQAEPAAGPATPAAIRGEAIFREQTCLNCHGIRGVTAETRVAPDLTHFADRETIGAGVLTNNVDNLTRWLKDPQRIKRGVHMPSFRLTTAEIDDLLASLETLQ